MAERIIADPKFNDYLNAKAEATLQEKNPERRGSERLGISTIFEANQIADPNKVEHFIDGYTDLEDMRPWR